MNKSHEHRSSAKYSWEKRGLNCFVCMGHAEVSRPGITKAWVAMVPRAADEADGRSWYLLREGENVRGFKSAKEAMEAVESYLDIFSQYHQRHSGESVDMSDGRMGVSGAQA